jgi:hypothetical protein
VLSAPDTSSCSKLVEPAFLCKRELAELLVELRHSLRRDHPQREPGGSSRPGFLMTPVGQKAEFRL